MIPPEDYTDVTYAVEEDAFAVITINRPDRMNSFRGRLFSRIVPTIRDIGLWGPRIQKAFVDMGVMDYATLDVGEQLANDGRVADEFDRKMFVEKEIAPAAS